MGVFSSSTIRSKSYEIITFNFKGRCWGHGLVHLLNRLTKTIDIERDIRDELLSKSQELDRQYIQPRYPNGFATGYPAEYYNEKDAEVNLKNAEFILQFVEEKINSISTPK